MLKKAKSVFLNNSFQEKNFSKPIDSLLSLRLTTDEFLKTLAHISSQTKKEFSTSEIGVTSFLSQSGLAFRDYD